MNWIETIGIVLVIIITVSTFVTEPKLSLEFGKAWIGSGFKVIKNIINWIKDINISDGITEVNESAVS